MTIWILLFIAAVFMTYRFFWGYPETRCPYSMIGKGEAAFLDAAAETLFPPGAGMPISGGQADLPGYAEAYLSELPRTQRRLIRALFFLFEQSPLLWPARGVGAFRRFSFLSPEQQERNLHQKRNPKTRRESSTFRPLLALRCRPNMA